MTNASLVSFAPCSGRVAPRQRRLQLEPLEPRRLLSGDPLITELMASNSGSLLDEDGASSDWIEIYNPTAAAIDLTDWALTDSAANLTKWRFPAISLAPGEHRVVFASGEDRDPLVGELHTNFKLSAGGEYAALVRPDGTVAHEYAPQFPQQLSDISYGLATEATETTWIAPGAAATAHVPTDDSLGLTWTTPAFDDALWTAGTTGVGFDLQDDDAIETPTEIPGNVLWLDASDPATIVEAVDQPNLVQQWNDKSGAGNHVAQTTVDQRPATGGATLAGENVITLDGANDNLTGPAFLPGGDDTFTIVALWRPHVNNTIQSVVEQAGAGASGRAALLAVNAAYGFNGQNNDLHDLVPLSPDEWRLTVMHVDDTQTPNVTIIDNGATYTGTTSAAGALNIGDAGMTVGRKQQVFDEFLDGDLAELIAYDRVLNGNETFDVTRYLDVKYDLGLTSAPGQGPAAIPGNVLWLDAGDVDGDATPDTLADGTAVASWVDKSPSTSGTVTQGTASLQPRVRTDALGGQSVVELDGGDWLGGPAVLAAGDDTYTFVAVWRPHVASAARAVFEQAGSGAGERASLLAVDSAYGFNGQNNDLHWLVPFAANEWRVTFMSIDNGQTSNVQIVDNGNAYSGTTNADNSGLAVGTLGTRVGAKVVNNAENLDGDIAEILVYDRVLSSVERIQIDQYLNEKYGFNSITPPPAPVHQWTFEDDTANDTIGGAHGTLLGGAQIVDGQLILDGQNDYVQTGPIVDSQGGAETITSKTLVAWVSLDNLSQAGGGVLTLQKPSGNDVFDSLVFGEASPQRWMAGSEFYNRTQNPQSYGFSETRVDPDQVMLAVVYGADNSVSVYRDGDLYGSYTKGSLENYSTGSSAEVLLGLRHIDGGATTGTTAGVDAYWAGAVEEARIYDQALTAQQVQTLAVIGPVGSETSTGDYADLIGLDIGPAMHDTTPGAYIRVPFTVTDPNDAAMLRLFMQYDDGFVAYINGVEVARRYAPDPALFDSPALATRPDWLAVLPEEILIPVDAGLLQTGQNVLAIHGLNVAVDNNDFLIVPELTAVESITVHADQFRYFTTPTPGEPNGAGTEDLGPIISEVTDDVPAPADDADLLITARVLPSFHTVAGVTLNWRVMYGPLQSTPMVDDGTGGDVLAGDGIYSAVIPHTASAPGEMVRWYVGALDTDDNNSRWPLFDDPLNSPEFLGTMIDAPGVTSNLPILHWFVEDPEAARTDAGTRSSAYFDGEFYDNFFVRRRGWATLNWNKRKFKFDFNPDNHFRYDPDRPRAEEFNLQSHYAQEFGATSYMRETLAYRFLNDAGTPSPTATHWQIRQNGDFYGLYSFVEQVDDIFLDRNDIDDDSPMYKALQDGTLAPTYEGDPKYRKANQKSEPWDDLIELTNALSNLDGLDRNVFLFDRVDLPNIINEMAAHVLMPNHDRLIKNYYVYLDPDTNEWNRVPWDTEQAFAIGMKLTDDPWANLYFGDEQHVQEPCCAHWFNYMHDAVLDNPVTREMYVRRVRSLMDEFLGQSAAENDYFESIINAWRDLIYDEAVADHARWGAGNIDNGVNSILNTTLPTRRAFLYSHPDIPPAQQGGDGVVHSTLVTAGAAATALVPDATTGPALGTTWTQTTFDDTGWTLSGTTGVGFERSTGYESLIGLDVETSMYGVNGSVYVRIPFTVTDPSVFDALTLRMKYDDGFIAYLNGVPVAAANDPDTPAWNSEADALHDDSLAVLFQDFDLTAHLGELLTGDNVLAIHGLNFPATSSDLLILPELRASGTIEGTTGPPTIAFGQVEYQPASGNQDEEFVELTNPNATSVDISHWELSGGIEHTFPPGTIIPAGGSLFVTPNAIAFRARSVGPTGGELRFVQGNYRGHISNLGETIFLTSGDGELVNFVDTPATPSPQQQWLRISEVMYHPGVPTTAEQTAGHTDDDDFEFIELINTSDTETLDLAAVAFTQGIDFTFDAGTLLGPGARILVVRDADAFAARYDTVGMNIAGAYGDPITGLNKLNNDGETLKLEDPLSGTIQQFRYNDNPAEDWPAAADGPGSSLEVVNRASDYDEATTWYASVQWGGSPGQAAASAVLARHVFYNESAFDATSDDDAIAIDKQPLMPGQTATFANWTSFSEGLNGLMLDVACPDGGPPLAVGDFTLRVGNDDDPASWPAAAAPLLTVRDGAGRGGADRVILTWLTDAPTNTWLQVTVRSDMPNTGLLADDIFYFANATGETGNNAGNALITAADVIAIRDNPRGAGNRADVTSAYDINRDRLVDALDVILARNNATGPFDALRLIAPPLPTPAPAEAEGEPSLRLERVDAAVSRQVIRPTTPKGTSAAFHGRHAWQLPPRPVREHVASALPHSKLSPSSFERNITTPDHQSDDTPPEQIDDALVDLLSVDWR